MCGKDNKPKEKSKYELILNAYKIGGLPLSLLIVGSIILSGGVADGIVDFVSNASPETLLLTGISVIFLGALCWSIETNAKSKTQLALIHLLEEMVKGAKDVSKDGANYHTALHDVSPQFDKMLRVLTSGK
ncbi:MAG: hypothetical protein ACYS21_00770 [Planctomycetota bacterium]|jgi:hypothetical protein